MTRYVLVSCIFLLGSVGFAHTVSEFKATIVKDYDRAAEHASWRNLPDFGVSSLLMTEKKQTMPFNHNLAPYLNVFYQGHEFTLCYKDCAGKQNINPFYNAKEDNWIIETEEVRKRNFASRTVRFLTFRNDDDLKNNASIIRQNTIYYWITRMFEFVQSHGVEVPEDGLKIYADRDVNEITHKGRMENNAFYSPDAKSLSFLPHGNKFFSRLLMGTLRPSGFDPSVIIHVAGHYVFDLLTKGINVNEEVGGGLNEGFADYLAMVILNTDTVGKVMMSGTPLREARTIKEYQPQMPIHDLGNVVGSALIITRNTLENQEQKIALDQAVIDTVRKLGEMPLATIFDFSDLLLKEFAQSEDVSALHVDGLRENLEKSKLIGSYSSFNLNEINAVLPQNTSAQNYLGVNETAFFPQEAQDVFNQKIMSTSVTIISLATLKETEEKKYVALYAAAGDRRSATPFKLVIEVNSGNVIVAYDLRGKVVESSDYAKKVASISSQYNNILTFRKLKSVESIVHYIMGTDWILRSKNENSQQTILNINGRPFPVTRTNAKLRLQFVGKLASLVAAPLKSFEEVTYYTTKSPLFKGKLPQFGDQEEYFLGYELVFKTGFRTRFVIEVVNLD